MFSLFKKDEVKLLQKEYERKLKAAMMLQRSGRIPEYAQVYSEAQAIFDKMEKVRLSRI